MKVLLDVGAEIRADNEGLTPLHVAASTTELNPKIAKLLIEHMTFESINAAIPETSDDQSTIGNITALHFAARNEHITRKFIQTLKNIDPTIRNKNDETAFHVAAKAENPAVIVSMLEVFTPVKSGWEMTDIDSWGGRILLEICAMKGNARGVELLIKYGAYISDMVLFDLIDESVSNPTMTDKLLDVYRTITDNWLSNRSNGRKQRYPRRGMEPSASTEIKDNIMLRLLTKPNDYRYRYPYVNVLEYPIIKGDKAFLNEIINTPDVFKMTEKTGYQKDTRMGPTKYDVTNFLNPRSSRGTLRTSCCGKRTAEVNPAVAADEYSPPRQSYLQLITQNRHLWEKTDILHLEPFLTITQPICGFVKLIYFVMALIQMGFMILFYQLYKPSYCYDTYHPGLYSAAQCNNTSSVASDSEPILVNDSPPYQVLNTIWLVWAFVQCIISLLNLDRPRTVEQLLYISYFSTRLLFMISLFIWYLTTFVSHSVYVICTSMVNLFGWLVTLSYFIDSFENASIFSFLSKKSS